MEGESSFQVSDFSLDSQNNFYFSFNQRLLKISNQGQKLAEKIFQTEYAESYEGEKNIIPNPGTPYLAEDGTLLLAVQNGYCAKLSNYLGEPYDGCQNMFYALNSQNLQGEPKWKKPDLLSPIALNAQEFYYQKGSSGAYNWHYLDLFAIDISTGNTNWTKHWGGQDSAPQPLSVPLIDNQNNVYFTQGGKIFGYSIIQILDNIPENGKILDSPGANYRACSSLSLANGVLYLPAASQITALTFPPD